MHLQELVVTFSLRGAGILIIIGGIAVVSNPSPENIDRDPVGSVVMLFAPAAIQLALGAIKIKKSSK